MPTLEWISTFNLSHHDECCLLGVTADLTIYVEEIYGADDWLAHHAIASDSRSIATLDEDFGHNSEFVPLALPLDCIPPSPIAPVLAKALNFNGPRLRGLREFERVAEAAYPLTVQQKFQIIEQFKLNILPMRLLGLSESYVLAAAPLPNTHQSLVCRRLRLAYALEAQQFDDNQQAYDYDSFTLYTAQLYDPRTVPDLMEFAILPGMSFTRPMDCQIVDDTLVVAEGGTTEEKSRVHILRIV